MSPATGEVSLASDTQESPAVRIAQEPSIHAAGVQGTPLVPRATTAALLLLSAVFLALHFVHLNADFPNHSPWMDWSKYTDEGWYGDAAIRQLLLGHWYVRGDFNPAVALPVWPAVEFLLFSITGVSLVAARALTVGVFCGILVAGFFLVRRSCVWSQDRKGRPEAHSVAASAGAALLAVSPFCFAFTRLAILEPLLVLLMLLALLAASSTSAHRVWSAVALGVILPSMVLTKTTAVFLFPSVAWMLWAASGYRLARFLRLVAVVAAIGGSIWGAYFGLVVRPRFLEDYRYLFSANGYTGMTRANAWSVIEATLRDGMWIGRFVYPMALAAAVVALVCYRRCLRNPLVPALMLWAGGYAAFLAYHDNLQPRYYLVLAVPLTLLVPVVVEEMLGWAASGGRWAAWDRRALPALAAIGFLAVFVSDARTTLGYVRAPQYTFERAAGELKQVVLADRGHSQLVLSISGSDLSLMTGLPSICDDFGTMPLEDRAAAYRPGWYATWNEVDDDKMDALSPLFHLERVAAFPAMDDPERNLLILYRLDPPVVSLPHKQRRHTVPKLLQTRIGQQPSETQLEH